MKKIAILTTVLILTAVTLVSPFTNGYAMYNDEKYNSYVNMNQTNDTGHAKYIIPNLYRQDASYANVKTFPLVINNSVEYFPLDIFALYPYLEVVYSKLANGFYINNTKNNHYVAFDLNTGITTTHDNQNIDIQAQIYYRTHYVPAKNVCEVLEMNFETYDDPQNGIRAARISDNKAKYTLNELVAAYSPIKKDPVTENKPDDGEQNPVTPPDISDDNPSQQITPVTPPPVTEPADPYRQVGMRHIYLTFENCPDRNTENILDTLEEYGKTAVFFLSKEKILQYPDTVRQIIAAGHNVGLYFSPQASQAEILSNEQLGAMLDEANNALYLVAKTKTRFIRAVYGFSEQLDNNSFAKYAAEKGFVIYDWSTDAQDYSGREAAAFEQLRNGIIGSNTRSARTVFVRFGSYSSTAGVLDRLLEFCGKYTQFRILTTDEYTDPPSFTN